jgi:hypothetical protein
LPRGTITYLTSNGRVLSPEFVTAGASIPAIADVVLTAELAAATAAFVAVLAAELVLLAI